MKQKIVFENLPDSALVRFKDFQHLVGIGKQGWIQRVSKGLAPVPFKKVGHNCGTRYHWLVGDIRSYLAIRI